MRIIRKLLDLHEKAFKPGSPLEKLYPIHEALDTFCFTPGHTNKAAPFVRDCLDLKRLMIGVVIALFPCIVMAMYNTGLQSSLAIQQGYHEMQSFRLSIMTLLGINAVSTDFLSCLVHGALYYLPVLLVTFIVGGFFEALFAVVRKHEINEGFFVTGMLFPLILPPSIPLWQVALGISFGVVIGKEIFGGTGMNFLNPALTGRCFLFFAYPQSISGNSVWQVVDGYTGATPLTIAAEKGIQGVLDAGISWLDAFLGLIPGCMGETSTLCCLFGAFVLILTGLGSWRIILSVFIGTTLMALLFNTIGSDTNPDFSMPFYWHYVLGGWAFGTVFMATDPVSAACTNTGRIIYGFLIGVLVVLIRVVNPAYPEGMMLGILLMNVLAPLIDHCVIRKNVALRKKAYAQG